MGKNIPKIVCVVGRTCSGKDSITREAIKLANAYDHKKQDYQMVVSYTTRPKRESETDGVEHKFITFEEYQDNFDAEFDEVYDYENCKFYTDYDRLNYEKKYGECRVKKLAFTTINYNKYFVTVDYMKDMIKSGVIPVYIIDPYGLKSLKKSIDNGDLLDVGVHSMEDVFIFYMWSIDMDRRARYAKRIGKPADDKDTILEFYKRSYAESKQFAAYEYLFENNYSDWCPPDMKITNIVCEFAEVSKGFAYQLNQIQFSDKELSDELDKCFPEIES